MFLFISVYCSLIRTIKSTLSVLLTSGHHLMQPYPLILEGFHHVRNPEPVSSRFPSAFPTPKLLHRLWSPGIPVTWTCLRAGFFLVSGCQGPSPHGAHHCFVSFPCLSCRLTCYLVTSQQMLGLFLFSGYQEHRDTAHALYEILCGHRLSHMLFNVQNFSPQRSCWPRGSRWGWT